MNLQSLIRLLDIGVQRDDLADLYKDFVNQARHDIMVRRNWNSMRHLDNITMPIGASTTNTVEDFKEFTPERDPVVQITTDGALLPCNMYTLDKLTRLRASFGELITASTGRQRKLSIFSNVDNGRWYVGLPPGSTATEVLNFRLSYYRFLPPLENDNDEDQLTRDYPFMVMHRAKSIAFSTINDMQWMDSEKAYEVEFQRNANSDARVALAGRQIRM